GGEQDAVRTILLEDQGGGHRRDGDLPGGDGVVLPVDQAVDVRDAGLGGEVVHLVVEDDSGAAGDEAASEAVVHGGGGGDGVSGADGAGYGVVGGGGDADVVGPDAAADAPGSEEEGVARLGSMLAASSAMNPGETRRAVGTSAWSGSEMKRARLEYARRSAST